MTLARILCLAAALVTSTPVLAALLHHADHTYTEQFGTIDGSIVFRVDISVDVYSGDGQAPDGKYLWQYTVHNFNYQPSHTYETPFPFGGSTDGFAGFVLPLTSLIPDMANIAAPRSEWVLTATPTSLTWDRQWGLDGVPGIMPGESGTFSFITDPRLISSTNDAYFYSWRADFDPDAGAWHTPLGTMGAPGLETPGALNVAHAASAPTTIPLLLLGLVLMRRRLTRC